MASRDIDPERESGASQALLSIADLPLEGGPPSRQQSAST